MTSEMRDRNDWVDEGFDGLREEIDGHFARQTEELGGLRTEIEHLTRRSDSFLARWGLASFPKVSLSSWETSTSSSRPSMPPSGLSWTDGRVADLQSHVHNASTSGSEVVAEIKARIAAFDREALDRRSNRQQLLFFCSLLVLGLGPVIVKGAILLLA
jgi:hypothetical protein